MKTKKPKEEDTSEKLNAKEKEEVKEEVDPIAAAQEQINLITAELTDTEEHIQAIKSNTLEGYFAKKYILYRDQAQGAFHEAQQAYKYIRGNRDACIANYMEQGVDTTELEEQRKTTIEYVKDILSVDGASVGAIVEACGEVVKANLLIEDAKTDSKKYCSKLYVKDKEKAKVCFNEAKDKYKNIRENRSRIIDEFKDIDSECGITVESLETEKHNMLKDLQKNLNIINPDVLFV